MPGTYTDRLRVFVWDNGTATLDQLQQAVANPSLFNEQVPNPYYGVPGISPSSKCGSNPTISRVNLLLPLSQYCDLIGQYNDPLGKQYYNGLEVKLSKRFSQGVSFQLSYTYSKTMAATGYQNGWPYQDPELKKEIAGSDRTHVFSDTTEWELPFGKGTEAAVECSWRGGRAGERVGHRLYHFGANRDTGRPEYRPLLQLQPQLYARWRPNAEPLHL